MPRARMATVPSFAAHRHRRMNSTCSSLTKKRWSRGQKNTIGTGALVRLFVRTCIPKTKHHQW